MSMLCIASKYSTKKEQSLLIDKKKFKIRKKQIIIKWINIKINIGMKLKKKSKQNIYQLKDWRPS
jgi:hypothetical protein